MVLQIHLPIQRRLNKKQSRLSQPQKMSDAETGLIVPRTLVAAEADTEALLSPGHECNKWFQ